MTALNNRVFNGESMWRTLCGLLLVLWVKGSFSDEPAHCWINPDCKGSISQSFLQEDDCCKFGGSSYIKCSKTELQNILMNRRKTQRCVRCPTKNLTTTAKPKALNCTPTTCPNQDERCVVLANTNTAYCVKCNKMNCNSSGPVCGTDQKTYQSECKMFCTATGNTRVAYEGSCQANPTCSTIKCKKGFLCSIKPGKSARCYATNVVCGSDGITYASSNDVALEACKTGTMIVTRNLGPCNLSDTPKVVKDAGKPCQTGLLPICLSC